MSEIRRERLHADLDEPVVLFLVGMRINAIWRVWEWVPVIVAMVRMLRELNTDNDGMLATRTHPGIRHWMVRQYWRSFDDLEAYAHDEDAEHLANWQRYADELAESGAVGIWHETYVIDPENYETVYNNMPPQGLGEVGPLVSATGQYETATDRFETSSDQNTS